MHITCTNVAREAAVAFGVAFNTRLIWRFYGLLAFFVGAPTAFITILQ